MVKSIPRYPVFISRLSLVNALPVFSMRHPRRQKLCVPSIHSSLRSDNPVVRWDSLAACYCIQHCRRHGVRCRLLQMPFALCKISQGSALERTCTQCQPGSNIYAYTGLYFEGSSFWVIGSGRITWKREDMARASFLLFDLKCSVFTIFTPPLLSVSSPVLDPVTIMSFIFCIHLSQLLKPTAEAMKGDTRMSRVLLSF